MTRYTHVLLWVALTACYSDPPDVRPRWTPELKARLELAANAACNDTGWGARCQGPTATFSAKVRDGRVHHLDFAIYAPDLALAKATLQRTLIGFADPVTLEHLLVPLKLSGLRQMKEKGRLFIRASSIQYGEQVHLDGYIYYY
jgi:hypothetical protein